MIPDHISKICGLNKHRVVLIDGPSSKQQLRQDLKDYPREKISFSIAVKKDYPTRTRYYSLGLGFKFRDTKPIARLAYTVDLGRFVAAHTGGASFFCTSTKYKSIQKNVTHCIPLIDPKELNDFNLIVAHYEEGKDLPKRLDSLLNPEKATISGSSTAIDWGSDTTSKGTYKFYVTKDGNLNIR